MMKEGSLNLISDTENKYESVLTAAHIHMTLRTFHVENYIVVRKEESLVLSEFLSSREFRTVRISSREFRTVRISFIRRITIIYYIGWQNI